MSSPPIASARCSWSGASKTRTPVAWPTSILSTRSPSRSLRWGSRSDRFRWAVRSNSTPRRPAQHVAVHQGHPPAGDLAQAGGQVAGQRRGAHAALGAVDGDDPRALLAGLAGLQGGHHVLLAPHLLQVDLPDGLHQAALVEGPEQRRPGPGQGALLGALEVALGQDASEGMPGAAVSSASTTAAGSSMVSVTTTTCGRSVDRLEPLAEGHPGGAGLQARLLGRAAASVSAVSGASESTSAWMV